MHIILASYAPCQSHHCEHLWMIGWKHTRLLMVEISVVNLRTEFGPSSSKIVADILDNLNSAGFALAKIEKRFWTMQYWTPGTKERNLPSDGIWWFVRPQNQKEMIPDWVAEGMISWSLPATSGQWCFPYLIWGAPKDFQNRQQNHGCEMAEEKLKGKKSHKTPQARGTARPPIQGSHATPIRIFLKYGNGTVDGSEIRRSPPGMCQTL